MAPVPDLDGFVRPGQGAGLIDVFRRRYLLSLLVRKEVQVRYRGSVLGWMWSYVKPITQFLVFFVALGVFLQLNGTIPNYPVYLFSGLVVINLFSESFSNGTKSLVDNAPLIKKIYLPRELFPVSSTLVAFINFLPQALVLAVVCFLTGWQPNGLQLLGIALGVLIIVLLAMGLSLFFGSINVSFRDAQNFVELILLVATWASPVLYQWTTVAKVLPDWLMVIYRLNPVTAAVELLHAGFWYPTTDGQAPMPPDLWFFGLCALVTSSILLVIGQLVFRRLERRFAQDL
ncbi:ABC transporter permease [Cryobacterium adonitolivorans]|uniref:Transport permease protein n=1 Tax=Cryobacterium adonitolivorans TaxID=1259189 RepID=A0A4R8WAE7_9MICO|nr:ABC transporter permease [Cryobacterium adonitolivorans]